MASESISQELPPEEAFMQILRKLHARWRLAIMLPPAYFVGGMLVYLFSFQPRGGRGLIPLPESVFLLGIFLGGGLVIFLWRLLRAMQAMQLRKLAEVAQDREEFLRRAKEGQLVQFSLCDLAGAPGILLFLLDGSVAVLAAFLGAGMFFYLAAFPSGKKLGLAMFKPETMR